MAEKGKGQFVSSELFEQLCKSAAYPGRTDASVTSIETELSWVFLVGDYAYKVKRPIVTTFHDYRALEDRHRACADEVRLGRRCAPDLYLGVVPIANDSTGRLIVEGNGKAVDYAVKLHRFPADSVLSRRLDQGQVTNAEIVQLAQAIADFHRDASRSQQRESWGSPALILEQANANFHAIRQQVSGELRRAVGQLERSSQAFCADHRDEIQQRVVNGFVRECHGDLHLGKIVQWQGKLVPFDGIEFSEPLRWIDVLSDATFTAVDILAHGFHDLAFSFTNAYLEATGDYDSPSLIRWYSVYRALARSRVAAQRSGQLSAERQRWIDECGRLIELAERLSQRNPCTLWITHGLSGSGKTTAAELVVQRTGAIRLRSDVERKRELGLNPTDRADSSTQQVLYGSLANAATYARLRQLAIGILRAGYSVVVDATFLRRDDRERFMTLATRESVDFKILDCRSDIETLKARITDRLSNDDDASDADLYVLHRQVAEQDPLSDQEQFHAVSSNTLRHSAVLSPRQFDPTF